MLHMYLLSFVCLVLTWFRIVWWDWNMFSQNLQRNWLLGSRSNWSLWYLSRWTVYLSLDIYVIPQHSYFGFGCVWIFLMCVRRIFTSLKVLSHIVHLNSKMFAGCCSRCCCMWVHSSASVAKFLLQYWHRKLMAFILTSVTGTSFPPETSLKGFTLTCFFVLNLKKWLH